MTERIGEARLELEAGNPKRALRLLWQEKADAAARGDADTLRTLIELAETIQASTRGRRSEDAALLVGSAKSELSYLERQEPAPPREQPKEMIADRASATGAPGLAGRIDDLERRLELLQAELQEVRVLASSEAAWEGFEERDPVVAAPPPPPAPSPPVTPTPSAPLTPYPGQRRPEPPRRKPDRQPAPPPPTPRPSVVRERLAALGELDASDLFGARGLAWAGGLVTLLGIVFFFILAVNNGWLSQELRCVLGAAASAVVYGFALYVHRRFGNMQAALAAAGAGIAGGYATLVAATALYEFMSKPAALAVAAGIAAVGVATALAWNAQTTAALGLVGALLGPALIEGGDPSVAGASFVALILAATIAVTLTRDWLETLTAAAVASFPQAASLFLERDPSDEWETAAVIGGFALLFVLAGVGLGLRGSDRPGRPILALALAAASIVLVAGLALVLEPSSPAGVAVIVGAFWILYLGLALAFQLVRGSERLERLTISLTLATTTVAFIGAHTWFASEQDEGYALLVVAGVTLLPLAVLARRGQRDLVTLLWATSLTVAAVGGGYLLTGERLALVWSAQGALLSFLALRAREARLQLAAAGYLVLALVQTLANEAPPEDLFRPIAEPAAATPAILFVAAGLIVFGFCFRRQPGLERRGSFFELPVPSCREGSSAAWLAGGALALYAASFGVLALCAEAFGDPDAAFERGQAAVTSLWATTALAVLLIALRRRWVAAHWAAVGLFTLALAKLAVFDFDELSETNFGYSLLAFGVLVGLAGYAHGLWADRVDRLRLPDVDLNPITALFVAAGALSLVPALWIVLDGTSWGIDRAGAGIFLAGAGFAALAASVFGKPGRRDLVTLLGAAAVALSALGLAEDLLDGNSLVLAWSALAALLAFLSRRAGEERLLAGAVAYLGPALALALGAQAVPGDFFREGPTPATGVPSVVFATLATAVLAYHLRPSEWRGRTFWLAGALAVYAASLAILGLFQWIAPDDPDSVDAAFQRGHTAVSSFWGLLGLALLATGLRRRWTALRLGGFALFGVALAKIFLYDLSTLSSLARALSFLGVGSVLLLAALLYQRLTEDRTPETP